MIFSIRTSLNRWKSSPGHSIRPVDPIGNDRIRVGFHRNPTSSIKKRSDPIGLLSESDSDEIRIGSDLKFIGFDRYYMRPIGSYQAESTWVYKDPDQYLCYYSVKFNKNMIFVISSMSSIRIDPNLLN
jgi:hypothetical protein